MKQKQKEISSPLKKTKEEDIESWEIINNLEQYSLSLEAKKNSEEIKKKNYEDLANFAEKISNDQKQNSSNYYYDKKNV